MTSKVFKYRLKNGLGIEIPTGSSLLKVGIQEGAIFGWFWVDNFEPHDTTWRTFHIEFTGARINHSLKWKYIDTVFREDGIVSHIFEEVR